MNRKFRRLVKRTATILGAGVTVGATGVIPMIAPVTNVYAADSYEAEKKDYDAALTQAKDTPFLTVKENKEKITVYESEAEAKKADLATKTDAETAKLNSAINTQKAYNKDYKDKASNPDVLLDSYDNSNVFKKDKMIEFLTDGNGNFSYDKVNELKFNNSTAFSSTGQRITSLEDCALAKFYYDRDGEADIVADRFIRGLEFPGNRIDLTNVSDNNYFYVGFVPKKGDTFTFENCIEDVDTGKMLDLIWTLEDFEVIEGVTDPTLFIAPKAGINIYGGLKTATFNVNIVEHDSKKPFKTDIFYVATDIDCNVYEHSVGDNKYSIKPGESGGQALSVWADNLKYLLPEITDQSVIDKGLVEVKALNGGYQAIAHADSSMDDNDPEGWCAFIARDVSSLKIKWDDEYSNSLKTHQGALNDETTQAWLDSGKTNSRTFQAWTNDEGQLLSKTNAWIAFNGLNFNFKTPKQEKTSVSVTTYELEVIPDPQKGSVTYIDKTENKTLETKKLDGVNNEPFNYNTADTIKKYTDKGYKLVSSDYPEKEADQKFDTDPKVDQDFTVVLEQRIVNIPPDKPGYDITEDQLNKTIKRTIFYKYTNKEGKDVYEPITQTVKLTRSATKNLVTGETTFTPWTEGKMDAVETKPKANYTHDRDVVEGVDPVKSNTKVDDEYVIFNKIPQKGSVDFTDRDTKEPVADTKKLNGYQAEPFNYTPNETIKGLENKGWDLVSNDFPTDPKDQVYDKDTKVDQDYHVVMTPHIETITPDNPKKPGDPARPEVPYPEGLEAKNLNKTLTRTIYYKYNTPEGEDVFEPVKQTVKLTRTAKFNYVTGEVTYGDWTVATIKDVKSPDKENYTYDRSVVEGIPEVTVDTKLEDQYVIYKKIPQKGSVDFTDRDTKEPLADTKKLNGYQAEPFNYTPNETIKGLENKGWDLVSNDFPTDPKDQVYDKDTKVDQDYHVVMTPHIETITPDNPKTPGSDTERKDVKYPEGVDEADLNKTFTRTIYYKYESPEGEDVFEPIEQSVKLTRSATFNYVTGEVIYGEWTTAKIEDVESQSKEHWQFDKAVVEGIELTSESEPLEDVYVIYTRIPEKGKVEFTDEENNPIADTHELNGFDEDPFDYDPKPVLDDLHNKGWDLISNDYPEDPKDQVFDSDPDKDQDFKAVHTPHIETITPDNPKKPGSDTDRKDVKYPEGVDEADLNKTFTRTIYFKYNDKNGNDVFEPVKQEVHLTREAKFNYVTGKVEYSEWTTATMDSVSAKDKAGYTHDRGSVDSLVLNGDSEAPADEYIIYTPVPETPVETPTTNTPVSSTPATTVSKSPSTATVRTSGSNTGDNDKTGLFAAIGVGAAAVIGGIAAFMKKRKKDEDNA